MIKAHRRMRGFPQKTLNKLALFMGIYEDLYLRQCILLLLLAHLAVVSKLFPGECIGIAVLLSFGLIVILQGEGFQGNHDIVG
jgi:hypothetical protein